MSSFDPSLSPLEGICVVEASAGTGKTYSLSLLYLRALIEQKRTPAEILVLTFSRAAANDLRTRIHAMLERALSFDPAAPTTDAFERLLGRLYAREGEQMQVQLNQAKSAFDLAQISTIHAFCLRTLNDHRLSFGLPAGSLKMSAGSAAGAIIERATRLARLSGERTTHGFADTAQAIKALDVISRSLSLRLLPDPLSEVHEYLEFSKAFAQVDKRGLEDEINWLQDFAAANGFNKTALDRADLTLALGALRALENDPKGLSSEAVGALETLDPDTLQNAQPKRRAIKLIERIPILTALWPALCALKRYYAAQRAKALLEWRGAVDQWAQLQALETGELSFDAAVLILARTLSAKPDLAAQLAQAYPVALIDEFQDTDQTQYAIFRALYCGRKRTLLYLIGDPKQAIYRFRGGDVFAYLKAQEDADYVAPMDVNYRSLAPQVAAVNRLYQSSPLAAPLGHPKSIQYLPVDANKPAGSRFSGIDWISAEQSLALIDQLSAVVQNLLNDDGFSPSELAVLVRRNEQVGEVAGALRRCGVAVRAVTGKSLFERQEFAFLPDLLRALGGDRGAWSRVMLLGPFEVRDPVHAMQDAEADFIWANATFARLGSAATLTQLCQRWAAALIPRGAFGLRILGGIQQTAEWLSGLDLGRHDLSLQLNAMDAEGSSGDALRERQTDSGAQVQVMTLHQAKGLEFGVVLLPFALRSARHDEIHDPLFHDPKAAATLTLDLGSAEISTHRMIAAAEADGDDFRLLYVGLTRAIERTVIFTNLNKNSHHSALARLLLVAPDAKTLAFELSQRIALLITQGPDSMRLSGALASPRVRYAERVQAIEPVAVVAPIVATPWRWSSFSSLQRALHGRAVMPTIVGNLDPLVVPKGPRGARYGECVHALLETLDFAQIERNQASRAHVAKALAAADLPVDDSAVALTLDLLLNAVRTPLPGINCALADLPSRDVIREAKFTMRQATAGVLMELNVPRGALTGFVDLIARRSGRVIVLDFKTNDLGDDPDAYSPAALLRHASESGYHSQGLIYARALCRRLALADPAWRQHTHFAGAIVLYLRGLNPDALGHGIVHLPFNAGELDD